VHKSLPALTQGSIVSAKIKPLSQALKEGVDVFRTTSPSYPIMASIEFAVKFPRNEKLEKAVSEFKAQYPLRLYQNDDYTKLCVLAGKDAVSLQKRLQSKGIFAEFCDGKVLTFYLSPATKMRSFAKLKKLLIEEFKTLSPYEIAEEKNVQHNPAPHLLENKQAVWVDLNKSIGCVCAKTFGQFPPCIPCVFEGEYIQAADVEKMKNADNVFGMENGQVCVYQIRE
jgi:arginine/lysine/ornithine decarboxylase